jgi:hypothetical protein
LINNPVNFVDPSGLETIVVSGGAFNATANKAYQWKFIDTALKELKKGNTWLVADIGWTFDQRTLIETAASNRGVTFLWLGSSQQMANYIDTNYAGSGTYNSAQAWANKSQGNVRAATLRTDYVLINQPYDPKWTLEAGWLIWKAFRGSCDNPGASYRAPRAGVGSSWKTFKPN